MERFTITRIEKNTRTCFLQGWIGLPLSREKSAVRCSVLRGSHVEKRHSNSGKFQSRSNRANIYELFLKRKEKKAKESKPRTKKLDEEYIISRKYTPMNRRRYHEEKQQMIPLFAEKRTGRSGERSHKDRAIIFARIAGKEPRRWWSEAGRPIRRKIQG